MNDTRALVFPRSMRCSSEIGIVILKYLANSLFFIKPGIESFSGGHVTRSGPCPYIHCKVDCATGVFSSGLVGSKLFAIVQHDAFCHLNYCYGAISSQRYVVEHILRPFIQGHVVTATGSSKKIAKNLAAKMMLDKLEEVTDALIHDDQMYFKLIWPG